MQAEISIHAPRAGRDQNINLYECSNLYFNPRAPCGARRHDLVLAMSSYEVFQSTRPVRGATFFGITDKLTMSISIHAPRAGRDSVRP